MTKEEFKARVRELVYIDDPWEDFLESMWDLYNEVNNKDLTMGGFVEKKFDELQEELDVIKKRIAELEEKRGETPHPYPAFPDNFPCDGTTCTNPFHDCINCPRRFVGEGQHKWFTATDTSNCLGRKKCD